MSMIEPVVKGSTTQDVYDEDIENLKTVGDIVKYIEDRVAE